VIELQCLLESCKLGERRLEVKDRERKWDSKENLHYKRRMAVTVHPNLRIDYFHTIDNKEKAYWLGFLYSDGWITNHNGSIRIHLQLSGHDEDLIDAFCDCLVLEKSKKEYRIEKTGNRSVEIRFTCKEMGNDLLKQGLMFRKSKIIEYPKSLNTRDLELAFLLGYYDGDGARNTTKITSGSLRFLEQAKKRFNLPYKIHKETHEGEICGRNVKGTRYRVFLGAELFGEMMKNYSNSMARKRWFPCDSMERLRRAAEASTSEMIRKRKDLQRDWRGLKKDELERLVWEVTLTQISIRYNVSRSAITKKCGRFGISRPEQGHWVKRGFWEKEAKQNR
jgi:hypothetical protein